MHYYVVKYSGPFGFIKPWTAVRDIETYSQQFLTPSIIEGLRQKLEVTSIERHCLQYDGISLQQEKTQTRGWEYKKVQKLISRPQSILSRGVLLNPKLILAFSNQSDAEKSIAQHVCLCRNEDILLPNEKIEEMEDDTFNNIPGFELRFGESEESFLVGFNRFNNNKPMYGYLKISRNLL